MAGMLQSRYNPRTKRIEYGQMETTLPEISTDPVVTPPGPSAVMAQQPGPIAPVPPANGGGMMRKPLGAFFQDLEKSRGLPEGFLAKTRAIESTNGTNLVNPNSSARGDFQFLSKTAKAVGLTNPMDPYASAEKAADLAKGNFDAFRARTGRDPTGADLYGMHQQGSAGYLRLMGGQRTGDAEMRLNGGAGLTGSQMVAKIHGMYDKAKPANLGEGFTFQPPAATAPQPGPTMEAAAKMGPGPVEPVQPAVKPPETYNGGIYGLMQGADYTGAGASKDFAGKMGDLTNGPNFAGAISGLAKAFGGGGEQQQQPDRPIVVNPDNVNAPNLQFLELLKRRRTGVV